MLNILTWILIFYFALPCDSEEGVISGSPEKSKILRRLGGKPPYLLPNNRNMHVINEDKGLERNDLIDGDIIPDKPDTGRKKFRTAVSSRNKLWPWRRVPYTISWELNGYKDYIRRVMNYLEQLTCIRFVPRTVEDNYVSIYKGQGCNSYVGRIGGAQTLSLGDGCYNPGTVIHELLHAIGFFHEHTRLDRDNYIAIHWNNIKNGREHNFYRKKQSEVQMLTPYDYNSVMHYGEYAFSKDEARGLKTMTPRRRGAVLGSPGKKLLSPSDIQRIKMLYKC